MTPQDFEETFAKLRGKWKTFYSDDMEEQVYDIVKTCDVNAFNSWIRKVVWLPQAPQLDAFQFFAKSQKPVVVRIGDDRNGCTTCDGHGNVEAFNPDQYRYFFCCIDCEAGHKMSRDLPRWHPRWLEHGWTLFIHPQMEGA